MDETSSFLLSIVDSSADAIIGLNPDSLIISWNPAAERIYGWSRREVLGNPIITLCLPDHARETALILKRVLSGERIRHYQTFHLKKDRHPFPVSLSISPVVNNINQIVGASFIVRDLSQQLSYEKNLHDAEQRYQKLKTSLELAHQIQERLLPPQSEHQNGLDIHARTFYCEDVGGDYYDFFKPSGRSDRILGLAVGDVSGHGTGAALLMAMAKGALQAEIEHFPDALNLVMGRLNQFFCRQAEQGMFMTLFLAQSDIPSARLQWCSSGQGPVYIYHPDMQSFEELISTGTPLGVLKTAAFECLTTRLKPGDILIVGTDGLWEARNRQGDMFSVERFRQILVTWRRKSAQDICESMLERVKKFTGQETLQDDATLMIVKNPFPLQLPHFPDTTESEKTPELKSRKYFFK